MGSGNTLLPPNPLEHLMNPAKGNMTGAMNSTPGLNPTETAMLEAFIPGYSMLSRFLISYLHVDPSVYIPYILTITILGAAARYIWYQARSLLENYCVSTAEIRREDEVYNFLMFWLSQQSFTNRSTHFVAGTRFAGSSHYEPDEDDDNWGEADEYDDEGNVIQDFDEYWTRATTRNKYKRLRFTPAEGTHYFWFRGRPIAFIREKEENNNNNAYYMRASERLYISCLGRNPTILKELLLEAQRCYIDRDGNSTVIYRGQRSGGYTDWTRCMARAPRALSTVVLDQTQKQGFIDDIKEYLHPRTRRWYSNRGIPYRRGYLLHGPPGTGKTSLCFAAAGVLGLELYLLNLSSKSLDEDDLMSLFHELPRRCIVLLEDVDCAGMVHKRSDDPKEQPQQEEKKNSEDSILDSKGVSLSALLNVIDGVAACEGRILVMTTNHPEKLDPALIRPGRVDMSIAFGYASISDIRELFTAIYSTLEGDLRKPRNQEHFKDGNKHETASVKGLIGGFLKLSHDKKTRFSQEQVQELSKKFSERIPAGEFTPAEIQGYLLNHKTDPEIAIEKAEKWVEDLRAKREENEKRDAEQVKLVEQNKNEKQSSGDDKTEASSESKPEPPTALANDHPEEQSQEKYEETK